MRKEYPPLNGPHGATDDEVDNPKLTDYCIGCEVIYCAFGWPQAGDVDEWFARLARDHGLGFFDPQSETTLWPDELATRATRAGKGEIGKPWWRFW